MMKKIKEDDALCFFSDDDGCKWVGPAYVLYACLGGNPDDADKLIREIHGKKLFSTITATESAETKPTKNVIWALNAAGIVHLLQRSPKEIGSLSEELTVKYVAQCFSDTFEKNPSRYREYLPNAKLQILWGIAPNAVPVWCGQLWFPETEWFDVLDIPVGERTGILEKISGSRKRRYYSTSARMLIDTAMDHGCFSVISYAHIRSLIYLKWQYFIKFELQKVVKSFINRPYILVPDRQAQPQLTRNAEELERDVGLLEEQKKAAVQREEYLIAHNLKERIAQEKARLSEMARMLKEKNYPKHQLFIQKCVISTPPPPSFAMSPPQSPGPPSSPHSSSSTSTSSNKRAHDGKEQVFGDDHFRAGDADEQRIPSDEPRQTQFKSPHPLRHTVRPSNSSTSSLHHKNSQRAGHPRTSVPVSTLYAAYENQGNSSEHEEIRRSRPPPLSPSSSGRKGGSSLLGGSSSGSSSSRKSEASPNLASSLLQLHVSEKERGRGKQPTSAPPRFRFGPEPTTSSSSSSSSSTTPRPLSPPDSPHIPAADRIAPPPAPPAMRIPARRERDTHSSERGPVRKKYRTSPVRRTPPPPPPPPSNDNQKPVRPGPTRPPMPTRPSRVRRSGIRPMSNGAPIRPPKGVRVSRFPNRFPSPPQPPARPSRPTVARATPIPPHHRMNGPPPPPDIPQLATPAQRTARVVVRSQMGPHRYYSPGPPGPPRRGHAHSRTYTHQTRNYRAPGHPWMQGRHMYPPYPHPSQRLPPPPGSSHHMYRMPPRPPHHMNMYPRHPPTRAMYPPRGAPPPTRHHQVATVARSVPHVKPPPPRPSLPRLEQVIEKVSPKKATPKKATPKKASPKQPPSMKASAKMEEKLLKTIKTPEAPKPVKNVEKSKTQRQNGAKKRLVTPKSQEKEVDTSVKKKAKGTKGKKGEKRKKPDSNGKNKTKKDKKGKEDQADKSTKEGDQSTEETEQSTEEAEKSAEETEKPAKEVKKSKKSRGKQTVRKKPKSDTGSHSDSSETSPEREGKKGKSNGGRKEGKLKISMGNLSDVAMTESEGSDSSGNVVVPVKAVKSPKQKVQKKKRKIPPKSKSPKSKQRAAAKKGKV